ncbi:MAG TPA: zf-HC2 domain-containing protein [Vicinamibacterales bacterium]|nr:zf-HC2 domain-containing protein [Vicinamibacterales bacterium]
MSRCGDLEPLFAAYVDGEVSAADQVAIDAHLQACTPCRSRVSCERTARALLVARRPGLKPCAPDPLRDRCAAHLCAPAAPGTAGTIATSGPIRPPGTPPTWGSVRTQGPPAIQGTRTWLSRRAMVPLSMAATLLLAVTGAFFFGLASSVEALAAQLVVDHVKCFQFAPGDVHDVDAVALGQEWTSARGWHLQVPASNPTQQLQLLTIRRCASTEGLTAHLMYKWRGQPFSVYVLNSADIAAGSSGQFVAKLGQEAVIWSSNGRTYAVVARARPAELDEVVRYVKRTAH